MRNISGPVFDTALWKKHEINSEIFSVPVTKIFLDINWLKINLTQLLLGNIFRTLPSLLSLIPAYNANPLFLIRNLNVVQHRRKSFWNPFNVVIVIWYSLRKNIRIAWMYWPSLIISRNVIISKNVVTDV